jgi:tetratricopeptide (TPR) repeat protein
VAILYSESRGAWVSLLGAVLALTYFALRYGTLRWWIPVSGAAFFAIVLGTVFVHSSIVRGRMAEVQNALIPGNLPSYVRIQVDEDALKIAHDYPVFGTGPATFTFVHPRYQSSTFPFKAVLTHDDYLNCLDDYGLVGFALAIFFVWAVTLSLFNRIRSHFRWAERTVVVAASAAWCALLIHSAVDFNLHIPANAMILLSLAGLGLRLLPGEEFPRHWSRVALAPLGRWLGILLFLFALAFGAEIARTALGDIAYERALDHASYVPTDQSLEGVQEALSYDPSNTNAILLKGDLYRVRALYQKDFIARLGEAQHALEAYQAALKGNPLDDTIEGRLGLTFDLMRRYPEAFFCYRAACTAQPYEGYFWSALGNHYWQRGLLRKAAEAYGMAAHCPHGFEGAAAAARNVTAILTEEGIAPPAPGINPLEPEPEPVEYQTLP